MNNYFRAVLLWCMALATAIPATRSQVISTIAGNGTMGHTGDGGPAVLAEIYLPNGIAVDSAGNIYTATSDTYVRKISTTGIITSIAGNGTGIYTEGVPATSTGIAGVIDIKFDRYWNLYLSVTSSPRIIKMNTAGIVSTVAGTGTLGFSGDGGPATAADIEGNGGIAIDTAGNIYISDAVTHRIRKVNTAGIITTIAGTGVAGYNGDGIPATAAQLNVPGLGWVDRQGNIYICDAYNYRVRKIDAAGIITTIAGTGVAGYSGDGGPATAAQIRETTDIFVDTAGNIYICDVKIPNNAIRKISPSGIITTIVGGPSHYGYAGDGGPATAALVNAPAYIARYNNGNIYFSDRQNNVIRMISVAPYFINGPYQSKVVCTGTTVSVDTLLAANDSNSGVTEHWSLISGPHHGTASVAYTATSTGSVVYPVGLTYASTPGYVGLDTFTVRITDSIISDTTTVYITAAGLPHAGTIIGPDTVCWGKTIVLADTTSGGTWGASNASAFVMGGTVNGATPGIDTIRYIVSNVCGADTAKYMVQVKLCPNDITTAQTPENSLQLYPNPTTGTFTFILSTPYPEDVHITITNLVGEKIKEITTATNSTTEISLNAADGIYFLNATIKDATFNSKIIKTSR